MKFKFCRKLTWLTGLPLVGGLLAGCSILGWGTAVVVGTASVVGYSVYEGGESVVTGVGNLAGGGDSKESETVVFTGKVLKAECDGTVEEVWLAAATALRQAEFENLAGDYDLLSGELSARTVDQRSVMLKFKSDESNRTQVWIWTGPNGDLKASETIYKQLRGELKTRAAAAPAAETKPESKEVAQ
jgi:hypothetical protein